MIHTRTLHIAAANTHTHNPNVSKRIYSNEIILQLRRTENFFANVNSKENQICTY